MGRSSRVEGYVLWSKLLKRQNKEKLILSLNNSPAIEVAEFLSQQLNTKLLSILLQLPKELRGAIFVEFDAERQLELFNLIDKEKFSNILVNIPSNKRVEFYQLLSPTEQSQILPYLPKKVREDVITLSTYTTDTVGAIMNTDFSVILSNMTVKRAIRVIREDAPSNKMIYYIYVVTPDMQMIGFVSLKDLVVNTPDTKVINLLHDNFVYAHVDDEPAVVARKIEKYNLIAIPILNNTNQLVGILRYDDAMDVIRAEETESMEKFMGIVSDDDSLDYLKSSTLQHFKKRVFWIMGLFTVSFLSEIIIHQHQHLLARITVLSLYLPMISAVGGNVGSQLSMVVVRAVSLGQITLKNWLRIIFKEAKVAYLMAICLFFVAFLKVMILSGDLFLQHKNTFNMAFAIALALSIQVIASALIGASFPLIAKYFNGDPAVAASPAIATLVDIIGMLIYFAVTMYFFW